MKSKPHWAAKTEENSREIEPDFLRIPALISIGVAQNLSRLIFFREIRSLQEKSGPELSENQVRFPLKFWPLLRNCEARPSVKFPSSVWTPLDGFETAQPFLGGCIGEEAESRRTMGRRSPCGWCQLPVCQQRQRPTPDGPRYPYPILNKRVNTSTTTFGQRVRSSARDILFNVFSRQLFFAETSLREKTPFSFFRRCMVVWP